MSLSGGDMTSAFETALSGAMETPASEASPASIPAQESAPEPSAPAATTQAEAVTQEPASANTTTEEPPKGEPPKWRWQDILANTRETTAKEVETRIRQEMEQRYEWAKVIGDHERDGLLTWRAAMNGDPQAIARIKATPEAMKWLSGLHTEPEQPQADPEPEPDLQTADGTPVYSATRQREWREWNNRQLLGQVKQEIQPLLQAHQMTKVERENAAHEAKSAQAISKLMESDPEFKSHSKEVAEAIKADPFLVEMTVNHPDKALLFAWERVKLTKVLPGKAQASEAAVLANAQQRAVASTANPGAPAPSAPKKFTTGERGFAEALEHFA